MDPQITRAFEHWRSKGSLSYLTPAKQMRLLPEGGAAMSKGYSNLFSGTKGHIQHFAMGSNTAEVWLHLNSTQSNYSGTELPKSFTLDTPAGNIWTHGNATEHMHEAIANIRSDPRLKVSNPKLLTQFILYDYWKSLSKTVTSEIKYGTITTQGHWEFIFAKPRQDGQYPVVKHALFRGL